MTHVAQNSTVQANGINIHYQVSGSGSPLILLHGGTATHEEWNDFLPAFTPHFTVYAPDSRGHGKTDNPDGVLSYPQMADDVAAFIAALKIDQPIVLGFSDGGQIALELGLRHPGVARALVISGSFYKMTPTYFEGLKSWGISQSMDFDAMQQYSPDWVEYLKSAHSRPDDPDYWKTHMRQIAGMWLTPIEYSAADLQKITVPALVALGDRDESVEVEQALEMYRMLPQGELLIFPNATHMGAVKQLANPLVLDFLLRQTGAGSNA